MSVFIDIPILTGLSSYVMLVLIAFLGYESGWKQGLLYSVFAFVSMTLAECIVGLATGFLDLNVFQSREYTTSGAWWHCRSCSILSCL